MSVEIEYLQIASSVCGEWKGGIVVGKVLSKLRIVSASLFILNLLLAGFGYGQTPLLKDLVAMWTFDNVGRPRLIEDASGNGHNARVLNNPKVVKGKFGTAMRFNGDFHSKTFLEVPDHEALQLTDVISIVAWVKRPSDPKDIAPYYILAKGAEWQMDRPCYGLALHKVFDNMLFFWYKGGYQGTDGIKDDQWHHYAAVAKNGARRPQLFIDGKPKSVTHEDGAPRIQLRRTPENSAINLTIGALVPGKPRFHSFSDNTIDEVAIFKTALTEENIRDLMATGLDRGIYAVSPSGKIATSWGEIKATKSNGFRWNEE